MKKKQRADEVDRMEMTISEDSHRKTKPNLNVPCRTVDYVDPGGGQDDGEVKQNVRRRDHSDDKKEGGEDNSGGRVLAPPPPYSLSSHVRHLESATGMCGMNEVTFFLQKGKIMTIIVHPFKPVWQSFCGPTAGGEDSASF